MAKRDRVLWSDPDVPEEALGVLESNGTLVAPPGAIGVVLAALSQREDRWLVVVPGQRELNRALFELGAWTDAFCAFPASEVMPHERLSPRAETVATRLRALHRWRTGEARVLITPALATVQLLVPGCDAVEPIRLRAGVSLDVEELATRLVGLDYRRVDLVERRGEFAIRGGIVDVFPPGIDHPVRLELFGDEVEHLRTFAVASQRSLQPVDSVEVWPCRELLATEDVRARAREAIADHPEDRLELTRLGEGQTFDGVEALLEIVHDDPPTLREILGDARVLLVEPRIVHERISEAIREAEELKRIAWEQAGEGRRPPAAGTYASALRAIGDEDGLSRLATTRSAREEEAVLDASAWEHPGDLSRITTQIAEALREGTPIVACAPNDPEVERIRSALVAADLPVAMHEPGTRPEPGTVRIAVAPLDEGFRSPWLALVAKHDLFGKRRAQRKRRVGKGGYAVPLDLSDGDYVVHAVHGIGRYREMVTREIGESVNDYLVLEYANGDKLFVAADQADALSKYVGGEQPKLSRLGGGDWTRAKARARAAVEDMAAELMALYAKRAQARGHAFPPDGPWQAELEDAFPYVETPDQLAAIDEVKADMERSVPMDRLVCGDVGFGKTEIAIRAAFKAVQDGKQVAVLVPTTLLAQQHHQTFSERFAPFPIRVAALSRFVTPTQKKQILDDIAAGRIDVVIGTHALLQKGVSFADLGLLVVDEEQRFGVKHKERIKQLRANVHVLTLSATPIPRTLEMAMSGIRDMSVIDTPPEDRHPVLTFVDEFDPAIVIRAIERELLRDGQVFYVHNEVHDIDAIGAWVIDKVPGVRVAVAHGQMEESKLEQVMLDVWERKVDVLVSTTIIESGLDIPTANTIIIDRADRLGLSQLYQLRGRVGRSTERAFAYFLYPRGRELTGDAHDRLQAIGRFTELGSGLQVALRDLEIRGAGNLLGAQQSGHIANVGFDLYMRMLSEAISEAKGETVEHRPEVKIDLPIDVHLPSEWIPREALRLEAYRRVADAPNLGVLAEVRAEFADRYGAFPPQAENLFLLAELRITVGQRGAKLLAVANDRLRISPFVLSDSEQVRFERLFPGGRYTTDTFEASIPVPQSPPGGVALWVKSALADLLGEGDPPSALTAAG